MYTQHTISTTPHVDGLVHRLRDLRAVLQRPDFRAMAHQRARGKLTLTEKQVLLFDARTFVEHWPPSSTLAPRHGERRVITGHGSIDDRPVAAAFFDGAIAAGAATVSTGQKLLRQMQWAEEQSCPLLIDWDCSGADINDGIASLDVVRQVFTRLTEISGRLPTLSIVSGLNAGCGAYAPVMTDTVIMIEGSMMAVTGPLVIKAATGENVTPDVMGGARLHTEQSGEAHYRVPHYQDAAQLARRYFSYLPQSMWSLPQRTTPRPKRTTPVDLRAVVTQARHNARLKRNASWDVRTFINAAVDDDTWLEYHADFATSAIVGLARIAGIAVVVIANQRLVLGGALTADASAKITRFLRLANAYHLPVLTLVDVPGFIATQAESVGQILSKGAALLMMYPSLAVPRISVVIDKAFGGAYCAMDSSASSVHFHRSRHYGFTAGQIAVMGKESGPFFTYGSDGGDPEVKERQQARYEAEFLNMERAYAGHFVVPLEAEALRQRLLTDVPQLYDDYSAYWQDLVEELQHTRLHCPRLYSELRNGAVRGVIYPL